MTTTTDLSGFPVTSEHDIKNGRTARTPQGYPVTPEVAADLAANGSDVAKVIGAIEARKQADGGLSGVPATERTGRRWAEGVVAWQLRLNVRQVVSSNWKAKAPTVHNVDGKCLRPMPTEGVQGREWLELHYAENREAEQAGTPRTFYFCTRCVIEMPPAPKGPDGPRPLRTSVPKDEITGKPLEIHGEPCPACHIEMSLDGVCSNCDDEATTLAEVMAERPGADEAEVADALAALPKPAAKPRRSRARARKATS